MTGILLTVLFSFFVESAKLEKKLEKARSEIFARQHLQMRLQSVFSKIDKGADAPLYSKFFADGKKDSLVLVFDYGIDPDPAFSGPVLGRIYIDEKKNLSLAVWPLEKGKRHLWRKEILLPSVQGFEFEFLARKKEGDASKAKEKIKSINGELEWTNRWTKSRQGIPSIIRLVLIQGDQKDSLQFSFLLPSVFPMITYFEGGQKR